MIDFTEIEPSNSGRGLHDRFELFARDFLRTKGFEIVHHPDRGPDRQKDLLVAEKRVGVGGKSNIRWLVSCKNFAKSGQSVRLTDEQDILDRVTRHSCQGFLGFYATLPSSPLNDKFDQLKNSIEICVYDQSIIEAHLLKPQFFSLFVQYYPKSAQKHRLLHDQGIVKKKSSKRPDRAMLIEAAMTATILIDLLNIQEDYFGHSWEDKATAITKFYKYSNHSNEEIALEILSFLERASSEARASMPDHVALEIQTLVLNYFPGAIFSSSKLKTHVGELCVEIGFNLAYDSIKYTGNLLIAAYGFSIIKHLHLCATRMKVRVWNDAVKRAHSRLEGLANATEGSHARLAKELVTVFRHDLKTKYLGFPPMTDELFGALTGSPR